MTTVAHALLEPITRPSMQEVGTEGRADTALDAINDMLETVRAHLDMDVAFISRQIGKTHRVFTHVAAAREEPLCAGAMNENDNSLCWLVIEGRLPEKMCDTSQFEFARSLPVVEDLDIRSHFSVPMKRKNGQVHGSLCCYSHRPRHEITERDMRLLRSAAALVSDQIEGRIELEEQKKAALDEVETSIRSGALSVAHQPIVEINTARPVGYECLLRLEGNSGSSPTALFERAREAGQTFELEMHAASHALATLERAKENQFISINVSPSTIITDAFASMIPDGFKERLVIEITENHAIRDYCAVKRAVGRIQNKAKVAIDDVGAGFAGLRHLVELDPDIIKIDRDLIASVSTDPARRALTFALSQFALETRSTLIAEGVETQDDLAALRDQGIRFAQGFALGRPRCLKLRQTV
ncbi:MAG: EAL domain-containing protein [Erythrobacter sp.]|uniref:sensor domain-containing phosphodiesterase n=1 Tax=Erythrobacter sp. TaxID=1042 RepID=UPI002611FF7D|nr:EAL domain-containing protein [Erythrobacter sp.]MDJ0979282.1 EAL domain-containing protein [Erythrobacter sp.]